MPQRQVEQTRPTSIGARERFAGGHARSGSAGSGRPGDGDDQLIRR
jgi:hypothetical protein